MKVFAFITSSLSGSERKLILSPVNLGVAFIFDDTGTIELGTYVETPNKFEALDKMRSIYKEGAWKLRFELLS
jgi:hypothetical protein